MRVTDFGNGIVLIEYPTAKQLGTAFVRMQEFFENPSPRFRGRYFKFIEFKEWYSKHYGKNGKFTYFRDYEGYNVSGTAFVEFFKTFVGKKLHKEEGRIFDAVRHYFWEAQPFYIIGAIKGNASTIDHELHHAMYHLFPQYKEAVDDILDSSAFFFHDVHQYLKHHMYSKDFYKDETAAYLMFDADCLEAEKIDTQKYDQLAKDLRHLFAKHKRKHVLKRTKS